MKYKYKSLSQEKMTLVGVGIVPAGAEFISEQQLSNPSIEFVGTVDADSEKVVATQAPQPNMITDLKKLDDKESK